jgi:hypothetical protein
MTNNQPIVKEIVDLFIRRDESTSEYALVSIDHDGDELALEIGSKENVIELANSILFYFAENSQ